MKSDVIDASLVISSFRIDRWNELIGAVDSVRGQSMRPRELILVVDHNEALLKRVEDELSSSVSQIVRNEEQPGLSNARNAGARTARGKLVAFLDDDAVASSTWLERLTRWCTEPGVVGAGGAVHPYWVGPRPRWFPEEFLWTVGCTYRGMPTSEATVRNPHGGCFCIRRSIFERLGGFRSGIGRIGAGFMGGEETDLCIRTKQLMSWARFVFDPQAVVTHKITPERAEWRYFKRRCFAEGVSKAILADGLGRCDALASERSYALHVLPKAIIRELGDGFRDGDLAAFRRAGAVAAGLAITSAGYVMGRSRSLGGRHGIAVDGDRPTSPRGEALPRSHDPQASRPRVRT
jgi:GT2 family glycosyltransferase